MTVGRRIQKELSDWNKSPSTNIIIDVDDSNLNRWEVKIKAPEDSLYAGGTFGVLVILPDNYPFQAPTVNFVTRIYHPNVTNDSVGNVCLGLLKPENWKPSFQIRTVLEALRDLLVEPQPDDPLEARIADEYRSERKEFEKNVKSYVQRYAKGPVKFDVAPEGQADKKGAVAAGGAAAGAAGAGGQ
ncbi:hypothetical protein N0V88_006874 [Collariella sp. IMI 366227]|nr:hypothetical protein N0V88_006874 [Collariella sp. IMI 366227]